MQWIHHDDGDQKGDDAHVDVYDDARRGGDQRRPAFELEAFGATASSQPKEKGEATQI